MPYLAEPVVRFIQSLSPDMVCDPRLERGKGEKLLLRLLAYHVLGLEEASVRAKRAIQFGAKTATIGGKGADLL